MRLLSRLLPALFTGALITGCNVPHLPPPTPQAYPSPMPASNLSELVKAQTETQNEIQENLNTPVRPETPMRVALLYRGFTPLLKPEDQQAAIAQLTQELQASGLVSTLTLVPPSLVGPSDDLETMRKIASRFQSNVLLIVTGGTSVDLAVEQPQGMFTNATSLVARTVLTGLAVDVLSGRFLAPIEVVGKAGPSTVNPDGSAAETRYQLEKGAETQAFTELKSRFLELAQAAGS